MACSLATGLTHILSFFIDAGWGVNGDLAMNLNADDSLDACHTRFLDMTVSKGAPMNLVLALQIHTSRETR
jgi:hypothetical protein